MAKKKKFKKAKLRKPNWVGDVDISGCVPGLVYNIYQCRKCLLEYKEDHARKSRKKFLLLPGNKKKQMVEVCQCEEPTPLLIKYKKCTCDAEYWGFYLREKKTCGTCGLYNKEPPGANKYYRLGEFYKQTDDDLSDPDKWDCLNRNLCLSVTKKSGSNKGIACLDCPSYEKGGF